MDELTQTPATEPGPAPVPTGAERREHPRVAVMWLATLRTSRGRFECLVINVSNGGAKVSIADGPGLRPGNEVTLDLSPRGTPRAEVVWRRAEFIGIRFLDPPETIAPMLKNVLKA